MVTDILKSLYISSDDLSPYSSHSWEFERRQLENLQAGMLPPNKLPKFPAENAVTCMLRTGDRLSSGKEGGSP